jgi:hypothetical protein
MINATRTTAASQFIGSIVSEHRSLDWYEAVLNGGLYEADRKQLSGLCLVSGDEYSTAEQEVVDFARFQVWKLRPDHGLGVL